MTHLRTHESAQPSSRPETLHTKWLIEAPEENAQAEVGEF
jgi:hypothetical protein